MIRKRGNSFEIRVYAGTDAGGKKQNFYATVQGTGRKAEREAKQKEGELLAKAAAGRVPAAATTFGRARRPVVGDCPPREVDSIPD